MDKPLQPDNTTTELSKLAAQRDALLAKLKEYETILATQPETMLQYAANIDAVFYQISTDLSKIIYVNPLAEKISGHSSDEIYRHPKLWFDCIYPDDRERVRESLTNAIKSQQKEITLEYRLRYHDGTLHNIFDRLVIAHDKYGKPTSVIGIITDISEFIKFKNHMLVHDQLLNVLNSEKVLSIALESMLKITCYAYGWDEGEVWLLDSTQKSLFCVKLWHRFRDNIKEFYETSYKMNISVDEGLQGEIIRNNMPILFNNLSTTKTFYRRDIAIKVGMTSAFGLPIRYQGTLLGVVIYFSINKINPDHNEVKAMESNTVLLGYVIQHNLSNEQMQYVSRHDPVTGLINRAGLENILEATLDQSKDNLVAVIMLDLDKFKQINETRGFDVGDTILKDLALKFKEQLTSATCIIADIGGDQYVFVSADLNNADEVPQLIQRVLAIIHTPIIYDKTPLLLTASIGVSIYPYDGLDHLTLLKNADIALNHAKSLGGDNVQYYSESLRNRVMHAIKIEDDIRKAIAENDLKLYYQPLVDLKTGNIIGLEALLRWQNPEDGLQLPGTFIPIAEESDLIIYLGEWVVFEVCRHFPLIDIQIPVSINLSARQLKRQYNFVKFLNDLLVKLSIPANLLEIEITESQLMKDPQHSQEILNQLQQMGMRISLDDFGTGYSSFEYLRKFKPNRIKIDKSFIDGLPDDNQSAGIVRAIIALCKTLDIKTTAEGVETAAQLAFLIREGCDEMQGFYFSEALPIYDVSQLIQNKTKLKFPVPVK